MTQANRAFPPHLRRMVDFCCDRYGCGHHIDGHGYGETCYVPGCTCATWRDHVGCDHRNDPDPAETQAELRRLRDIIDRALDGYDNAYSRDLIARTLRESRR